MRIQKCTGCYAYLRMELNFRRLKTVLWNRIVVGFSMKIRPWFIDSLFPATCLHPLQAIYCIQNYY